MQQTKFITKPEEIVQLFPQSASEIQERVQKSLSETKSAIDSLLKIPENERTFKNTLWAMDEIDANLSVLGAALHALEMGSSDESIRTAAHDACLELHNFSLEHIAYNQDLYNACKSYATGNGTTEKLNPEERYFLEETIRGYEKIGLNLPQQEQDHIKALQKDLAKLCLDFNTNIATDRSCIIVSQDELAGLSGDFLKEHETNPGEYTLYMDYPTYTPVMEECSVASTRKKMWEAYNNRAHPVNSPTIHKIMELRHKVASALGYKSYAEYCISDQMAETPAQVKKFLEELIERTNPKVAQECDLFMNMLTEKNSHRTKQTTFKPWDIPYAKAQYKKHHLNVDEQKIAEYFPLEKTIDALLGIYTTFLGVHFKMVTAPKLWHPDVTLIEARTHSGELAGFLMLDLHPRPFKYSHACELTIKGGQKLATGRTPTIAVLFCNFPKPSAEKPALLHRSDVITFFHEFGHAVHALLGATELAGFSGPQVKRDFVEMPSQMLEEWMWDREILKRVSSHYKTGEPLSDEMITNILNLKNYDAGDATKRQLCFAQLSLACHDLGEEKNIPELKASICKVIRPHVEVLPEDHFESSFGHLAGYSAQYYGYLWSKVYALDMFYYIKEHGLLNPEIGKRYVDEILSKGGSQHPKELIRNFLGRDPKSDAFFKDLGI